MPTIWLARHGNREDFVDITWREQAARPFDPGLSEDGVEQARRLGQRLRNEGIAQIYASPYLRVVETAHHIAEVVGLPIFLEPGVGEWLNPVWFPGVPELLPGEELVRRFPRVSLEHVPCLIPTYPEREAEALARAAEAVRCLAERTRGPILVVGHGASVSGAVEGLVGDYKVVECALCALFQLVRQEGGWKLARANDTDHLEQSEAGTRFH
jgi:broad specificity phosphatase PhoE